MVLDHPISQVFLQVEDWSTDPQVLGPQRALKIRVKSGPQDQRKF